jgi:PAS domain S-box-containing protein
MAILSFFDKVIGPKIIMHAPEDNDFKDLNQISGLMDFEREGFFIHITDNFKSANMMFSIPSEYARGSKEDLQLSVVVDAETNIELKSVRKLLKDYSKRIIKINDCYKAFYLESKEQGDQRVYKNLNKIFRRFFKSIKPMLKALRNADRKLIESEERYRELVENVNSIILKWDFTGNICFINSYGEKFFGYDRDEIIGKNVLGTIVPDSDMTGKDMKALIAEIQANPDKYEKNINENITRKGKKVKISWTNSGLKNNEGTIVGILSVGNDISHLKEIEDN